MIDSRNGKARGRTDRQKAAIASSRDAGRIAENKIADLEDRRRSSNPLTWTKYSKDVNVSIAGLGSTRTFKSHPGKPIPMRAATWRESPAEADRAAKQALRAKAKANKTRTGAAKSL